MRLCFSISLYKSYRFWFTSLFASSISLTSGLSKLGLTKVARVHTSIAMDKIVNEVKTAFRTGKSKHISFRVQQLNALKNLIVENEAELSRALKADLGKCSAESYIFETDIVRVDVEDALKNIQSWTKPDYVSKTLMFKPMSCYIHREPLGVALIMGAWNYPLQLTLLPLVGAIAAGNCAIIKPSELAENVATLIADLVPKYLDRECFRVICGGVAETTELLREKFDFICYTGGANVARIIMTAAAKHLTPVLLELGGKSPVYVDESISATTAANRIAWGRFSNAGQTCVAPDYIMCQENVYNDLVKSLKVAIVSFYGEDPSKSADYGRIINERHWDRLDKYLSESSIELLHGGKRDKSDRYISPTIVKATPDNLVMNEEIFGPILPIFTVRDEDEAVRFINSREKPLSLYVFSTNKAVVEKFKLGTSSGSFVVNDTVLQAGLGSLPFGGVGESGMGSYHGKFSFNAFSHQKSCMEVPTDLLESGNAKLRYPPYTDQKVSWARYVFSGKGSLCNIL